MKPVCEVTQFCARADVADSATAKVAPTAIWILRPGTPLDLATNIFIPNPKIKNRLEIVEARSNLNQLQIARKLNKSACKARYCKF